MVVNEDFTLPADFVRKKFLPLLAMLPLSVLIMPIVGMPLTLHYFVGNLAFVALVLGVSYLWATKSVWVSLSQVGIQGRGPTGRKLSIPWQVPAVVERGSRSSVEGVLVAVTGSTSFDRLFIPGPILALPSFRRAMQRVAPPTHALSAHVAPPT
jgi:hypothetical protein